MCEKKHGAMAAPCKFCPYRQDAPSGIWHRDEYAKLLKYDGDMAAQAQNGGLGLFLCHERNNCLCSGWLACHGPDNLIALRFNHDKVEPEVFDYETSIPVFSSGFDAMVHGVKDNLLPSPRARKAIDRLAGKLNK